MKRAYLLLYTIAQHCLFAYFFLLNVVELKKPANDPTKIWKKDKNFFNLRSLPFFYDKTADFINYALIGAFLEAFHGLFGITRTSFKTAMVQAGGRGLIGYLIFQCPPDFRNSTCVLYLLLTWSLGDILRYPYYIFNQIFQSQKGKEDGLKKPRSLAIFEFLRYNCFIIIYPIGAFLELWTFWNVLQPFIPPFFLYGFTLIQPLAFISNYIYMMKQRSKLYEGKKRKAKEN